MRIGAQTPSTPASRTIRGMRLDIPLGAYADKLMAVEVQRALSQHTASVETAFNRIDVSVYDGGVALNGYVATDAGKAMAELIALQVPGVTGVTNHLVADDDLEVLVAYEIACEPGLQSLPIYVRAKMGVIRLAGQVNNPAQRVGAEQAAASVPSVRGIINPIETPGVIIDAEQERVLQPGIGQEIFATDGLVGLVEGVIVNVYKLFTPPRSEGEQVPST